MYVGKTKAQIICSVTDLCLCFCIMQKNRFSHDASRVAYLFIMGELIFWNICLAHPLSFECFNCS